MRAEIATFVGASLSIQWWTCTGCKATLGRPQVRSFGERAEEVSRVGSRNPGNKWFGKDVWQADGHMFFILVAHCVRKGQQSGMKVLDLCWMKEQHQLRRRLGRFGMRLALILLLFGSKCREEKVAWFKGNKRHLCVSDICVCAY